MNDYLGNLVARTLGQMPVVQPRLASRFESVESPAAFSSGAASDLPGLFQPRATELMEEEVEIAADHDPMASRPKSPRRRPPSDQTAEGEESPGAVRPDGVNLFLQALPGFSVKTSASQSQPDVLSQPLSPAQAEGKQAPLLPRQPSSTATEVNRADDSAPTFADLASPPRRQETLIQTEARRADSPRRQEVENRRDSDDQNSNRPPPEVSSRVHPLQPADWLSPVSPPPVVPPPVTPPLTEREPVIKVTIGRVEVRAVTPAAPAPTATATEQTPRIQALPLSEYLRRRNNGEL
jgi:hypothetical protein